MKFTILLLAMLALVAVAFAQDTNATEINLTGIWKGPSDMTFHVRHVDRLIYWFARAAEVATNETTTEDDASTPAKAFAHLMGHVFAGAFDRLARTENSTEEEAELGIISGRFAFVPVTDAEIALLDNTLDSRDIGLFVFRVMSNDLITLEMASAPIFDSNMELTREEEEPVPA